MPKETFYNLPEEKKEKILEVLKKEFITKPFYKVNVKGIVEQLEIARGSFYQYFENLEDSYFTVLQMETIDIHSLFMKIFEEQRGDLNKALVLYGERVKEILFEEQSYMIYKNRYLYWSEDLDNAWSDYNRVGNVHQRNRDDKAKENHKDDKKNKDDKDIGKHKAHLEYFKNKEGQIFVDFEKVQFIKGVVHSLIKRIFQEKWSAEQFLEIYHQHMIWIEKGVH